MPRRRKNSNLQRRERNKELKRQTRRKEKDDCDLLTKSDSNGLNFPKKAENELNFPKKAENGLNFPKKSENGLNFPKKSENGLNFPKKSETAENDMPVAAKYFADSIAKLCTDSDAKTYANAVTQSFTESSLNFAKCFPKECFNVCCDFDETFADAYPNDVAYINGTTYKNLSLNEKVIIQNSDIEMIEPDPEIEVTSYNSPCSERFIEDSDAKTYANAVTQSFTESSLNFAKCFPKECFNVCCDFDETFADAYPNDVAYINGTTYKNLALNEEVNIQNSDIEMIEPDPEIEVTFYNNPCSERFIEDMDTEKPLLLQPNSLLWNAEQIIFGSFHQNDNRFLDQSRGFQCTCNALCMLVCEEIQNSSELD